MKVGTGAKLNFELGSHAYAPLNNSPNAFDGATKRNFVDMQETMNVQVN